MQENLELCFRALALAIALESFCWALFPSLMRKIISQLLEEPDSTLRIAGSTGLVLAALIAFFVS